MIVMICERVTPSLRGELTRWMIQPKSGVFIGRMPARVRDLLWQKVCSSRKGGAATMVYSSDTEQGFRVEQAGDASKTMANFEGLWLPRTPISR